MQWTSKPPTKPGWYFYQRTDGDFPIRVGYVFRARLPVFGMCVSLYYPKAEEDVIGTYLQDLTTPHRWAGPIPEPVEPEDMDNAAR